jgi:hypothetical protein
MTKDLLALLCLMVALLSPIAPRPAQGCGNGVVYYTATALAAIQKALPQAKLTDGEREKVVQLLHTAPKGGTARMTADFDKALSDAMEMLNIKPPPIPRC